MAYTVHKLVNSSTIRGVVLYPYHHGGTILLYEKKKKKKKKTRSCRVIKKLYI